MSEPLDPKELALKFTDCINRRDVDGLGQLMTHDHCFIDPEDELDEGRRSCLENWQGFFQIFPDYKNITDKVKLDGDMVIIEGKAECSDSRLAGPAIWTAKIEGDKIKEWRVYEDNPANRNKLIK